MNKDAVLLEVQERYHAHMAFSLEHPAWMQLANAAVARWGRAEVTLQQAVAEALMEAHAMGARGKVPEYTPPGSSIIRRTRPAHAPSKSTIIRRTR